MYQVEPIESHVRLLLVYARQVHRERGITIRVKKTRKMRNGTPGNKQQSSKGGGRQKSEITCHVAK